MYSILYDDGKETEVNKWITVSILDLVYQEIEDIFDDIYRLDPISAARFCATHECEKCPVSVIGDFRTAYEKKELHIPCWDNLVGVRVIK